MYARESITAVATCFITRSGARGLGRALLVVSSNQIPASIGGDFWYDRAAGGSFREEIRHFLRGCGLRMICIHNNNEEL